MEHRSSHGMAFSRWIPLCIALFFIPQGFSVTSDSTLDRYILVGTILDQSKGAETKNVAVLQEKGEGSKRVTLAKGDLLPDGSMRVTTINRNEVILFDGKKSHMITYAGHAGSEIPKAGESDESSADYFTSLEEAAATFDNQAGMQSHMGEYHYEMQDGIYVLVKDTAPMEVTGSTASLLNLVRPGEVGSGGHSEHAASSSSVGGFTPDLVKIAQERPSEQTGPTPFRRTPPSKSIGEEDQLQGHDEQEGTLSCENGESCTMTEPLEIEEIMDNSAGLDHAEP